MVSRWKMIALLSLCLVGTIACGFSTWIWSESGSASTGEIDVNVGDVKSSASIVYQSSSTFTYGKSGILHRDENGYEYFDYNFTIESVWLVNASIYNDVYYSMKQFGLLAHNGKVFNFLSNDFSNISFSAKYSLTNDGNNAKELNYLRNSNVKDANRAMEYQIDLSTTKDNLVYLSLSYSADMTNFFTDEAFEDYVYNSVSNSKYVSFDLALKESTSF